MGDALAGVLRSDYGRCARSEEPRTWLVSAGPGIFVLDISGAGYSLTKLSKAEKRKRGRRRLRILIAASTVVARAAAWAID